MSKPSSRYFIGSISPASAVTLLGLTFGVGAPAFALIGEIALCMVSLVAAGICDLFDGWVARRYPRPGQAAFGAHIDSLVDMASFGVGPALIGIALFRLQPFVWLACLGYASCAAVRLAHFNTGANLKGPTGRRYFTGLPVAFVSLIVPSALLFARGLAVAPVLVASTYAVVALAFVARVPVPKPSGAAYIALPLVGGGIAVAWLVS